MAQPKLEVVKRLPLLPHIAKKLLGASKVELNMVSGSMILKVHLPNGLEEAKEILSKEDYSFEQENDCLFVKSQRRDLIRIGKGFTFSLQKPIGRLTIGDYQVGSKTYLGYLVLIREGKEIELNLEEMLALHEKILAQ